MGLFAKESDLAKWLGNVHSKPVPNHEASPLQSTQMYRYSRNHHKSVVIIALAALLAGCSKDHRVRDTKALEWTTTEARLAAKPGELELFAEFPFVNRSGKPVTIESAESDCDCTLPEVEPRTYAPQAAGKVKVRVRVGMNQGREEKHITVAVRGAAKPDILTVRIDIPEVLRIEPRSLSWAAGKEADTKAIEIKVVSPQPVHVRTARSTNNSFETRLETVADGNLYRIHIKPRESATPKSSQVLIETSYPYAPWNDFTLPLTVK
jgi:uncharacterized protein DUF1573